MVYRRKRVIIVRALRAIGGRFEHWSLGVGKGQA